MLPSNAPLQCPACSIPLSSLSKLTTHLERHLGQKPFSCKICSRAYVLKFEANRHIKEKHPNCDFEANRVDDPNYQENPQIALSCQICKGTIRNREDLRVHAMKHIRAEGEEVREKMERKLERRKRKEEKRERKGEKGRRTKDGHRRSAEKVPEADRELRNKRKLRILDDSQLRKLAKTTFRCLACSETLPNLGDLNLHLNEHMLLLRFHCQACDFTSPTRWEGLKHTETVHEDPTGLWIEACEEPKELKLTCKFCSEDILSVNSFDRHALEHYAEAEVEAGSHHH